MIQLSVLLLRIRMCLYGKVMLNSCVFCRTWCYVMVGGQGLLCQSLRWRQRWLTHTSLPRPSLGFRHLLVYWSACRYTYTVNWQWYCSHPESWHGTIIIIQVLYFAHWVNWSPGSKCTLTGCVAFLYWAKYWLLSGMIYIWFDIDGINVTFIGLLC